MTSYGPPLVAPPRPQPPPGPGVRPPFAAPPIDGDRTRIWVGLGVGAAALVLCCLVGVAGVGGIMVTYVRAVNEQAQASVREYLDGLTKEDYAAAYGTLCNSAQQRESERQFADRVSRSPRVVSYTLHDGEATKSGQFVVPADVSFTTGREQRLLFTLEQDVRENRFEVCGIQ